MMVNKRAWTAAFALSLAGCAGGDLTQDPAGLEAPSQSQQGLSVPLERVPRDIHRRAAQLLEDVRGSESAPKWRDATLAPEVRMLYRPDVVGVAYYEFRVLSNREPMGYIIASSGAHDFPIAHWNFEGPTLTDTLARQAGTEVATFYKVDSLTYVAEGSRGELLASLGELPARIVGQELAWLDKPIEPTDVNWVLDRVPADDREAELASRFKVLTGPSQPAPIRMAGWTSWQELKERYRESYGTLAESLRRQAAQEWETESLARESGEGLVVGRSFELAMLYAQPQFRLSGEGASMVRAELVDTAPGRQMLVLTPYEAKPGVELPVSVDIAYGNGSTESLRFVLLAREDVGSQEGGKTAAMGTRSSESVAWADVGAMGSWSSWVTSFAGSHTDQRLYQQMSAGTGPNTSSCASGCGGTAWAMLFGWGDVKASQGHAVWSKRWGLYRQNGGTGSDAVAPLNQDTGVRNMTWEIRNQIGTWCAGSSGPTFPWDMDQSSAYLNKRTAATVSTHYNVFGVHEDRLRNKARDSIRDRHVPAIIGTGWLNHYPLAYGYRVRSRTVKKCFIWCWNETEYQRQFYVNQGWGGSSNGWVNASTWFAGQLYAN
jgi:hypothetical protein